MLEVEDYEFAGRDGPVRLTELFGETIMSLTGRSLHG